MGAEPLEQDRAADQRDQRRRGEQPIPTALIAAGPEPALDDDGDAADAEQKPGRLATVKRLAERESRDDEQRDEDRIGAGDQRREPGRDAVLHPEIAEPEIERVVGHAEKREQENAAAEMLCVSLSAAPPKMKTPATRKRVESRKSGGQSTRRVWRPQRPTTTEEKGGRPEGANGRAVNAGAGAGPATAAGRMGNSFRTPQIGSLLSIWKLNDRILKVDNEWRENMLDLDLLRSFVCVVDAGGFTRAGERVHRTQSTVSQQIRRLEETLGCPLLHRNGKQATPTEEGERLLSYARRILALAGGARRGGAPGGEGVVRLGVPEDFAAYRLTELFSDFARSRPGLRLDVRCGLSVRLLARSKRGGLDLALQTRRGARSGGVAAWPEELHWVTSRSIRSLSVGLGAACVSWSKAAFTAISTIHALEVAGRTWHMAFTSPNLPGIQAAVSAGLGVSILPDVASPGGSPGARRARRVPADPEHRARARHRVRPCDARHSAAWPKCSPSSATRRAARDGGAKPSVANPANSALRQMNRAGLTEQMRGEGERAEKIGEGGIAHVEAAGECAEGRHDHGSCPRQSSAG